MKMKCKDHPKYKGTTKPNRDCQKCWKMYEKKNPNGDTYQNWMHKCKIHKKYTAKHKPNNECQGCWDYYNWKHNTHISLTQIKYNKNKKNKRKLKKENYNIYKKLSKLLKKNFIKKDAYYHDYKQNYDKEKNPYQYILTTAVINFDFFHNISKYKLFKFFDEIHKMNDKILGENWLDILKINVDKSKYESLYNEYISEPHTFSSYALEEYKKFIETKYFENKHFNFDNYNLEIL
jgi:hypothetical protein